MVVMSVLVGESVTGRRLMSLPVSECTWSVSAGDFGSMSATIPLSASDYQSLVPQVLSGVTVWSPSGTGMRDIGVVTEPVRTFMAVLADDRVIVAGPIVTREWSEDGRSLTIAGLGQGWALSRRIAIPATYAGRVQDASLDYTGLSLGTIVKRLVQATIAQTGGALPIVLPADEAGASERHYLGFELGSTWDRISQISKVIDGPEVALDPRLTADRMGIEHVLRTGTLADPTLHQAGQDWYVDMSVPRGDLGGLTVKEDASSITSRAWATGKGSETALLISVASDPTAAAAGYILTESVRSYSEVSEQATLDAHAAADVDANRRPWQTWTLKIPVDERLGQYRNGDWWSVRVGSSHPYLASGLYRSTMTSHSGSLADSMVSIALVPTMEGAS